MFKTNKVFDNIPIYTWCFHVINNNIRKIIVTSVMAFMFDSLTGINTDETFLQYSEFQENLEKYIIIEYIVIDVTRPNTFPVAVKVIPV